MRQIRRQVVHGELNELKNERVNLSSARRASEREEGEGERGKEGGGVGERKERLRAENDFSNVLFGL